MGSIIMLSLACPAPASAADALVSIPGDGDGTDDGDDRNTIKHHSGSSQVHSNVETMEVFPKDKQNHYFRIIFIGLQNVNLVDQIFLKQFSSNLHELRLYILIV